MKVVIAIDSLKGSLSSMEAGRAIEQGILNVLPDTEVTVKPLADGGEGTTEALVEGMGGDLVKVQVHGPLETPVTAAYGMIQKTGQPSWRWLPLQELFWWAKTNGRWKLPPMVSVR